MSNPEETLFETVQAFCTCDRKEGERYTNFVEDHKDDCLYRRHIEALRQATRQEGFTRA